MSKLEQYLEDVKQVAGERYEAISQHYNFELAYQDRMKVEEAIREAEICCAMVEVD